MATYTETRVISLNSENATTYKNGDFLSNMIFGFSGLLKDEPDIIQRQITLSNAQLPVSFYIVNYTNNVFIIKNNTSGISYTITIPIGNYNSTNFISIVTSLILSVASITMTISIDSTTGRLSFSSSVNFSFMSSLSTCTANQLFGFSNSSNLVSSLSGTYKATAPYPLNLLGIKQLQVKSSYISATNFSSNSNGQDCLLATIPVNVGAWGMITFDSSTGNNITFSNVTLDDFDIQIVDAETNKPVNFNNCGWTMTFLIHLVRMLDFKDRLGIRDITKPLSIEQNKTNTLEKSDEELRILES